MEIKIIENRENMLFRRKEVKLEVETDVTPSREDAKKIVSEKIKCPIGCVYILKIDGKFGERVFTISAEVYDNEKEKQDHAPLFKKKDIESEKKANEAKIQPSSEEKVEEVKNE